MLLFSSFMEKQKTQKSAEHGQKAKSRAKDARINSLLTVTVSVKCQFLKFAMK